MRKLLDFFSVLLFVTSFASVVLAAHVEGWGGFLKTMTKENGFFEWMSVLLLLSIAVYGAVFVVKNRRNVPKRVLVFSAGFALLGFLAAMEEISWGQQVFGFRSGEYFAQHNYQKETNLHNLIPAEIFSSIVYSGVYTFFVFVPLIVRFFADRVRLFRKALPYTPSLQIVLIVLYGAAFQAWFYDDFGAWFDMGTQLVAVALTGLYILLRRHEVSGANKLSWLLIVLTVVVFMASYRVFGFFNMQYEIREMFVDLAALYYFIQLTQAARRTR